MQAAEEAIRNIYHLPRSVLILGHSAQLCVRKVITQLQKKYTDMEVITDSYFELSHSPSPKNLRVVLIENVALQLKLNSYFSILIKSLLQRSPKVVVLAVSEHTEEVTEVIKELFSKIIIFPPPNIEQRIAILSSLLVGVEITNENQSGAASHTSDLNDRQFLLKELALITPGFTQKDLSGWCRAVVLSTYFDPALKHHQQQQLPDINPAIPFEKFRQALRTTKASAIASFGETIIPITWKEFSGYSVVKKKCFDLLTWFISRSGNESIEASCSGRQQLINCMAASTGLLLHGPPGVGKTHLVRALCGSTKANWLSLKGSTVFSKYMGEAERIVRVAFQKARSVAPCVLVLDEIDALTRSRKLESSEDCGGGASSSRQILSTLLCEMDGVENRGGVFVIGCTNQPKLIDQALLRQGRMEHMILMTFPTSQDRQEILSQKFQSMQVSEQVNSTYWAEKTDGFSCGDLAILCREAGLNLIRECIGTAAPEVPIGKITNDHLDAAWKKIRPQALSVDMKQYEFCK